MGYMLLYLIINGIATDLQTSDVFWNVRNTLWNTVLMITLLTMDYSTPTHS